MAYLYWPISYSVNQSIIFLLFRQFDADIIGAFQCGNLTQGSGDHADIHLVSKLLRYILILEQDGKVGRIDGIVDIAVQPAVVNLFLVIGQVLRACAVSLSLSTPVIRVSPKYILIFVPPSMGTLVGMDLSSVCI